MTNIHKNTGKIILLIFLIIAGCFSVTAFILFFSKKGDEGFISIVNSPSPSDSTPTFIAAKTYNFVGPCTETTNLDGTIFPLNDKPAPQPFFGTNCKYNFKNMYPKGGCLPNYNSYLPPPSSYNAEEGSSEDETSYCQFNESSSSSSSSDSDSDVPQCCCYENGNPFPDCPSPSLYICSNYLGAGVKCETQYYYKGYWNSNGTNSASTQVTSLVPRKNPFQTITPGKNSITDPNNSKQTIQFNYKKRIDWDNIPDDFIQKLSNLASQIGAKTFAIQVISNYNVSKPYYRVGNILFYKSRLVKGDYNSELSWVDNKKLSESEFLEKYKNSNVEWPPKASKTYYSAD